MNVQHTSPQNDRSCNSNVSPSADQRNDEQVRRNRRDDFSVGYTASSYNSDSYLGARSYVENSAPRLFRFG